MGSIFGIVVASNVEEPLGFFVELFVLGIRGYDDVGLLFGVGDRAVKGVKELFSLLGDIGGDEFEGVRDTLQGFFNGSDCWST
jgi:hypothetical protein